MISLFNVHLVFFLQLALTTKAVAKLHNTNNRNMIYCIKENENSVHFYLSQQNQYSKLRSKHASIHTHTPELSIREWEFKGRLCLSQIT